MECSHWFLTQERKVLWKCFTSQESLNKPFYFSPRLPNLAPLVAVNGRNIWYLTIILSITQSTSYMVYTILGCLQMWSVFLPHYTIFGLLWVALLLLNYSLDPNIHIAQIAPMSFQTPIQHRPAQVRCIFQWQLSGHQQVRCTLQWSLVTNMFAQVTPKGKSKRQLYP